jgi:hypothetical protein
MFKRLKYLSRQARPMTREEIDEIVAAARVRNADAEITGALVVSGNVFFQMIEGPAASIDTLFAKIRTDLRHTDVVLLGEQTDRPTRLFPAWRMERIALEATPASAVIEATLRRLSDADGDKRAEITTELSRLVAAEARAAA